MHILMSKTLRAASGLVLAAHLAGFAGDTQPAAAATAATAAAAAGSAQDAGALQARPDVYGIVNLVPFQTLTAQINAGGQVAVEYIGLGNRVHVGFFDGQRLVHPIAPGSTVARLGALNDRGELAFLARYLDPAHPLSAAFQPFRWSPARGLVRLPSFSTATDSYIPAINNNGEIAGASYASDAASSARAVRWTAANRLARLGLPAGYGESYAIDINNRNVSVGYAIDAAGVAQAVRWDGANRPSVLGTLGGASAIATYINDRGDIAGMLDSATANYRAFLWSPGRGLATPGPNTVPVGLNAAGEMVGRIVDPGGGYRAFRYSRSRGLVDLHPASFYLSEANGVNDAGVAVGVAWRNEAQRSAYRWSGTGAVDLNTRLLNPPAGLVLTSALGIAANGDIVADSNAGPVLLRWGGGGTDAPVLGPVRLLSPGLDQPVLNRPVQLTLSFRDRNPGDRHTATIDWGDGRGPQRVPVRAYRGGGEVRAQHSFTREGDYDIIVRVTDSTGRSTIQYAPLGFFNQPAAAPAAAPAQPGPRVAASGVPAGR